MSDIRVFTAEHHDPWFNLATEDWLFNVMDRSKQVLFLWRNRPSIIIGRFQNGMNATLPRWRQMGYSLRVGKAGVERYTTTLETPTSPSCRRAPSTTRNATSP